MSTSTPHPAMRAFRRASRGTARPWRLAQALTASLILHTAVVAGILSSAPAPRHASDVVLVDLAGPAPPSPLSAGGPGAGFPAVERPTADPPSPGSAAASPPTIEGRVDTLIAERDDLAARLDAERAARGRLGDRVAALSTDNVALASALAEERERAAQLERSLAERTAAEAAAIHELERTYEELLAALREEITEQDVALRRAREGVAVSIVDRVLFPSGQATLTADGRAVIDKVADVLATMPARRIVVEGHTDDVPIGPDLRARFSSNWELSTARATEVVRELAGRGVPRLALAAVGRADTRPVASNDTEAGRHRNRRIEIILSEPIAPPIDADDAGA